MLARVVLSASINLGTAWAVLAAGGPMGAISPGPEIAVQSRSIHVENLAPAVCPECGSATSESACAAGQSPDSDGCTSRRQIRVAATNTGYTLRACEFYPGGGRRTPQEMEACQRDWELHGLPFKVCRSLMRAPAWKACDSQQFRRSAVPLHPR